MLSRAAVQAVSHRCQSKRWIRWLPHSRCSINCSQGLKKRRVLHTTQHAWGPSGGGSVRLEPGPAGDTGRVAQKREKTRPARPIPGGPATSPPSPRPRGALHTRGLLIRPLPPLAQSQRRLLGGRRGFVSARSRAGSPISGRGGAEGGRAGGSGRGKRGPRSLATLRPMGNSSWGAASPAGGCGGDSKAGLAVIGGAASGKGNGRCG